MSQRRMGGSMGMRNIAAATLATMALGIFQPALAAEMATFSGSVLAPDGAAAQNFKVVFKDADTGQVFESAATSATGAYQVSVPVGGRYKLDSVTAPDGSKLPVQNVPPIPVRVAGTNRLDVKFTTAGAATAAAAGAAAAGTTVAASTPPPAEEKKKDKSGTPWWKSPGGITGIVLGAVAVGALALSGGDGGTTEPQCDNSASCSGPNCCPDR